MKAFYSLIGIIVFSSILTYGTNKAISKSAKTKQVTVFLNGAQIEKTSNISIEKGLSHYLFEGLPQQLNTNSIQVKGAGKFTILSIKHQINYLKDQKRPKEMVILEDSLTFFKEKLDYQNNMMAVYNEEESMLIANKSIGGSDQGVKIFELKEAVIFFRTRLKNIKEEKLTTSKKIKELSKKIERISAQIGSLRTKFSRPTSEILVSIASELITSGKLNISYFVQSAGWNPIYDLRVSDINNPIDLTYKANVYQSTGEDWDNVQLTLSTGNPSLSAQKPSIYPWYLNFYSPIAIRGYASQAAPKMRKSESDGMALGEMEDAVSAASFTSITESTTSIEFKIKIPYTVPSDGKEHAVEMQKYKLPADFEYYCAPKLDKDAFLTAKVTKWEELNLLNGSINLFFEDTYVGNSYVDTRNTSDTLSFSLGRDKNIVVTRIKLNDFSSKQTIGSNKKETRAWEINVRNKKRQAVSLFIEDQFPVSTNKEIVIDQLDLSGGKYNEKTGSITWKFDLEPSGDKKINLMYSVKYPKDQTVILN